MRLSYLAANQAWAFVMKGYIVPMGDDCRRFFTTRISAVVYAHHLGLDVDRRGQVSVHGEVV